MPGRIDPAALMPVCGTRYPPPYDEPCRARIRRRLADAAGLTQFGVNLTRLPPGAWSSQRHWHTRNDEFICVLEGEVTLVTNDGSEVLRAGDYAGFPAGAENGHHFRNDGTQDAVLLEIGSNQPDDTAWYSDIDMVAPPLEQQQKKTKTSP